jgi:hypothetical protein
MKQESRPLSARSVQQLKTFGRTWGMLKYFAPKPTSGEIDWDSVFIEAEPRARVEQNPIAFNRIISSLIIASAVRVEQTVNSIRTPIDTLLGWTQTDTLIDSSNRAALYRCASNFGPCDEYYMRPGTDSDRYYSFVNEVKYSEEYPNESLRLLGLFRYWNIIEYFYPDKTGLDWTGVIEKYIAPLVQASDTLSYQLTMMKLCMEIHDTHSYTESKFLDRHFGTSYLPVALQYIDSQTVVTNCYSNDSMIKPGMVLDSIDGSPIQIIRDSLAPYVAYSNEVARQRDISFYLRRRNPEAWAILAMHDGQKRISAKVRGWSKEKLDTAALKSTQHYERLEGGKIYYMNLGVLTEAEATRLLDSVGRTKGLILDLRIYPQHDIFNTLVHSLSPSVDYVKYVMSNLDSPGKFYSTTRSDGTGQRYLGKVVLLVDEFTQSAGEFFTMALQAIPGSVVIGSQTAGADGPVWRVEMPGGIKVFYSSVGIHYPDGTDAQHAGVKIDIRVRPTIEDIAAGRDPLRERAEQVILGAAN